MKIKMNLLQRQRILIFRGGENKEPKSTSIFTPIENYHAYLENNFHPYILPIGVCQRIPPAENEQRDHNPLPDRRGLALAMPQAITRLGVETYGLLSKSDPIEKRYIERRISILLSTKIMLLINKIRHFLNYGIDYLGQGHFMSHLAAIFRPKLQPLSHYAPLNLSLIPLRYMPNEP